MRFLQAEALPCGSCLCSIDRIDRYYSRDGKLYIRIIDYKSGNLRSISNGFKKLNCDVEITDDVEKIANAKHLVLPGVGAFGTAMKNIEPFKEVIYEHVEDDKPFLGICLGQQVLMSSSEETENVKGLVSDGPT